MRSYGSGSGNGQGEWCCFAVDTGNHDSGSAIVEYASGMHLTYSQNFFVRKDMGRRGARFMGYYGSVEFEFNTATLRDAQIHPERYRDLVVRVATYAAYFVEIGTDLQNDIINRLEFSAL